MSVTHLKVPDSFSKLGSLYIKDNQCKNIEYPASSSNKIQPSIYNQRRVINHPLEVNDTIGPCRLNISNEQTSCPSKMIVPIDFDLQKDKHHSRTNKHIAPTGKKKAVQQKIGQHIMISNSNTTISLTLQKKMKNDMLLNSNINHINANSHINMIMNINKKSIVYQQQHLQQQIDQQQLLFTTMAKQISKKDNTSLHSHTVLSLYSNQVEFINNIKYISDHIVSTLINISCSSSSLSSFSNDGLSTETGCTSFPNSLSFNLTTCLIAYTPNTLSKAIIVPILTIPSFYLRATMITSNYIYLPMFFYSISPKNVHICMHDVFDRLTPSIIPTTMNVTIANILTGILARYNTMTIPNTSGCKFTKTIHHHLSHRHDIRDQRNTYQHKPTSLLIPNEHSIVPNSHSMFINIFAMSPHIYEFNTLIPINTESNAFVIIDCERTRTTTLVTHYIRQLF